MYDSIFTITFHLHFFYLFCRYLATGDSYRTIGSSFRVGVSTVSALSLMLPLLSGAVWWRSSWLCPPQMGGGPLQRGLRSGGISLYVVEHWMASMWSSKPLLTRSQFFNYKGTFSIVLLAVVYAEYCFRVIDVG